MAMQLMAGNSAIEVDQGRKEDRALFAGAQKVRHIPTRNVTAVCIGKSAAEYGEASYIVP